MARQQTEKDIKHLSGLSKIRNKVSMYLGSSDGTAMWTALREALDNGIDEVNQGRNDAVTLVKDPDNKWGYWIVDNGGGMPVKDITVTEETTNKKVKISALKALVFLIHAGGKFENNDATGGLRGCFHGSTQIQLVDGRTLTMEQLYAEHKNGVKNYVWSVDRETGDIHAQPIEQVQLTKKVTRLTELTLDTGDTILCTEDHPFLTTGLKKRKAKSLLNRSLLAMNINSTQEGYLYTSYGDRNMVSRPEYIVGNLLSRLVAAQYYTTDLKHKHVHHIDENLLNNNPENLSVLTPSEHYAKHPNKLAIWTKYLQESAEDKSEMMAAMNSDTQLADSRNLGKATKIAMRVLQEGYALEEGSYTKFLMHGAPSWESVLSIKDCEDYEFISEMQDLYAYLKDRINQGFSTEKKYLDSCLDYSLSRETSCVGKTSEELEIKRLFGKMVNVLDYLKVKKVPKNIYKLQVSIKNKCKRGTGVSLRSLCAFIDIEEFILCYLAGTNPLECIYSDQSEQAKSLRRHLFDKGYWEYTSRFWENRTTTRVLNDFLRKTNALLDKGLPLTRKNFELYYTNACGKSSWYSGVAAAKKRGLSKKNVIKLARNFNHKVIGVKTVYYEEPTPVYDLVIPNDHNYRLACGVFALNTHGVGVKALNAVSDVFTVYTKRDGQWYMTSYEKGVEVEEVQTCNAPTVPNLAKPKQGTVIYAELDPTVFDNGSKIDTNEITSWFETTSYFTEGVSLCYVDAKGKVQEWEGQDPLDTLLADVEENKANLLTEDAYFTASDKFWDLSLAFTDLDGSSLSGYAAGLYNQDGGHHVNTVFKVVSDVVSQYAGKKQSFNPTDLREGLIGSINIKLSAIKFHNQEKTKLVDERCGQPLYDEIYPVVEDFFKKNKELAKQLCERASRINDLKADFKANKAVLKVFKEQKKRNALPTKLVASVGCTAEERELYIVEGDSAGGSAKRARDASYQEVLPIKGKIKNPFKQSATDSEELLSLLMALGYDPNKENPAEELRVGKLILLTDGDVDGLHIQTLIIGAILAYIPEMFEQGRVYACLPYEYMVEHKGEYYFSIEKQELMHQVPASAHSNISHIKGWGEIDHDVLSEMAFNSERRRLYRIMPNDLRKTQQSVRALMESEGGTERKKLLGLS